MSEVFVPALWSFPILRSHPKPHRWPKGARVEGAWEPRADVSFACEQVIGPLVAVSSLELEEAEQIISKFLPAPSFCLCRPFEELQSLTDLEDYTILDAVQYFTVEHFKFSYFCFVLFFHHLSWRAGMRKDHYTTLPVSSKLSLCVSLLLTTQDHGQSLLSLGGCTPNCRFCYLALEQFLYVLNVEP